MGVWEILAPVKTQKYLKELKGQTLAVDLAIWVCESEAAVKGKKVEEPYLRNLFFRVKHLTKMGINLIFVLDGKPPELKREELAKRNKARYGEGWETSGGKLGRSRFNVKLKRCRKLLDHLGIPWLQAAGEAEAMCAMLNKKGMADAVLTEDNDAFLYGATTVYRDYGVTKPQIDCYSMDDIETKLGLDNNKLIALALLLGCDYIDGVLGIGRVKAMQLLANFGEGVNVLDRFQNWAESRIPEDVSQQEVPAKAPHCKACTHVGSQKDHGVKGCVICKSDIACHPKSPSTSNCTCSWHVVQERNKRSTFEQNLMGMACGVPGLRNRAVIEEYQSVKDICPEERPKWKRPNLLNTETFMKTNMKWSVEYTVEQVLPLATLWDQRDIIASGHPADPALHLRPAAVVKTCIRQGVKCVEIEWHKQAGMTSCENDFPNTIEEAELFTKAFPDIMRAFEEEKLASKPQKKGKKRKAEPTQSLASGSSDRTVDAPPAAVSDLSSEKQSTSQDAAEPRL